jgi:hypothetical protein
MLDFMLAFFSNILNMNLRDHHDIPFALPLVAISFTGFTIAFIILRFIGNEEKEKNERTTQEPAD